jgi:hypothetical protein
MVKRTTVWTTIRLDTLVKNIFGIIIHSTIPGWSFILQRMTTVKPRHSVSFLDKAYLYWVINMFQQSIMDSKLGLMWTSTSKYCKNRFSYFCGILSVPPDSFFRCITLVSTTCFLVWCFILLITLLNSYGAFIITM